MSMNKPTTLLVVAILSFFTSHAQPTNILGRKNEVFRKTDIVNAAGNLQGPWEVTYGPDDSLWITECSPSSGSAAGYKVRKVSPVTGGMRTILDLNTFTDAASVPTTRWQRTFFPGNFITGSSGPKFASYQGGLMGLAIHPEFATNPAKRFVYLAYGHNYITPYATSSTTDPKVSTDYKGDTVLGNVFMTWVVRFEYVNNKLVNPVTLCDTIRGSNDHNSGRMIIHQENGTDYLYYCVGDMGAGQFDNKLRINHAQDLNSYEGKIMRFNLEEDGDATQDSTNYNRWIPNDNPYNVILGKQSAVYANGIRNNQGLAYGIIAGVGRMYGSSHGPFSDDEINLLQMNKNYGHPLVIGYAADGNYNGAKAGTQASKLPLIINEQHNADSLGNYMDPVYSNYNAPAGDTLTPWTIQYIYNNKYNSAAGGYAQDKNNFWASEAYSGMDLYSKSLIPGWKNSLLVTALKWGRVVRMKLNAAGTGIQQTDGVDTVTYFQSQNRFRDLAISPNGRTLYVVMERSTTSSGPSSANPVVPSCLGCVHRYEFLGYNDDGSGASMIPNTIALALGSANLVENVNQVSIDSNNKSYWVPITDTNSNVLAEINAGGQVLGKVTSAVYKNSGAVRQDGNKRLYLDRNITITTDSVAAGTVKIRLYITNAEFNALKTAVNSVGAPSGVNANSDLGLFRNTDVARPSLLAAATRVSPVTVADFGTTGKVVTANIPINGTTGKTSSFYFANASNITLPTSLITFNGHLNINKVDLVWKAANEVNAASYVIERSVDGINFTDIGSRDADGTAGGIANYAYSDLDVLKQPSLVLFYRLRIVDQDARFSYSNAIPVSLASVTGRMMVSPNPVSDVANVTAIAIADGKATWKLVDANGRTVSAGQQDLRKGNNFFTINMHKFGAGVYVLYINGKNIEQQVKIQKL